MDAVCIAGDDGLPPRFSGTCPTGEFATGFGPDGIECSTIDEAARLAFLDHCDVYAGWSTNCDACSDRLDKWARVGGLRCTPGAGNAISCEPRDLSGSAVNLLSLRIDRASGDFGTIFVGFDCDGPSDEPTPGPCAPGSFATSVEGGTFECISGAALVAEALADSCELFYGWRPDCVDCGDPPLEWGKVGTSACSTESTNVVCRSVSLEGKTVDLLGVRHERLAVDEKLYVGMRCASDDPGVTSDPIRCPPGQLIVGIGERGGVLCENPGLRAKQVVGNSCSLYHGHSEECDVCAVEPANWGRVSSNLCQAGNGDNTTCLNTTLEETAITLLRVDTDAGGNAGVKEGTELYFGTRCREN